MSSDRSRFVKFAAAMFGVALGGYALLFMLDDAARYHRGGAWEVEFTTNRAGEPALKIGQAGRSVSNLVLEFPGESAPDGFKPSIKRFDKPETNGAPVPFGRWVYGDLMALPGVVTLELFASMENGKTNWHEVELSSRALLVNRQERAWIQTGPLRLSPSNKFTGERIPAKAPISRQVIHWILMALAMAPLVFILYVYFTRGRPVRENDDL